ncbi:uncharacterized protein C2orf15 homolog [Erinaceus europaeus]|uniref:Uncharacterized protein C2orf15 homolog n=1 Tax=Erinaceus europaeus TaxID=9365 RepID=A0A1S3W9M0_ERIEU|nr:uncharacterized protein C2orf15 homolog [Erinaceus europaeus]
MRTAASPPSIFPLLLKHLLYLYAGLSCFSQWPGIKFLQLKEVPAGHLDICSGVPVGFSLSKCATQVSAMHVNSKVDEHLIQGAKKNKDPVTQLFQNTKKIRLEHTNQENFTRSKGTGTGSLSEKDLGSVVYVKGSDGIEMTDVE